MEYVFNTTKIGYGPFAGSVPTDQLSSTPTLRRAELHKAVLFGGPLVAACLETVPLVGDRDYVLVDTKVSMLLPGFWPSIPGWHTDGVPRHRVGYDQHPSLPQWQDFSPYFYGNPSLTEQLRQHTIEDYFPRFHSLHVGNDCPTEFVTSTMRFDLEHSEDHELYGEMTRVVEAQPRGPLDLETMKAPAGQWLSWDWWQIHRCIKATERGFRLWIRVTESNDPPLSRDFVIRSQTQVYVDGQDQAW